MDELQYNIINNVSSFFDLLKKISEKMDKHHEEQIEKFEKMDKRNDKQDERFKIQNQIFHKKLEEINKKLQKTNHVSVSKELEQISTPQQSNVGINKVRQAIWHSIHLSFP